MHEKKICLFVIDGAADRCLEELENKTPLSNAHTPNLDFIARIGTNGQILPRKDFLGASTDVTHFKFLGYSEDEYPGRSVLEAVALGLQPESDCLYFSALLASTKQENGRIRIVRENIPFTEEEVTELFSSVSHFSLGMYSLELHHQTGRYGILVLKGPHDKCILDTDPFKDNLSIGNPLNSNLTYRTAKSAKALAEYIKYASGVLSNHPVNMQRIARGLPPFNIIATKWCSKKKDVVPFFEKTGMKGAIIARPTFFKGLAKLLEMDFIRLPDLSTEKSVEFLIFKAEELLKHREYDFVLIHLKKTDEISHLKKPELKVKELEKIDTGLNAIFKTELLNKSEYVFTVAVDHPTPSKGNLIHSGEPVPVSIVTEYLPVDNVSSFDELSASSGWLGKIDAKQLMPVLLNAADRIAFAESRMKPFRNIGSLPDELINPFKFQEDL